MGTGFASPPSDGVAFSRRRQITAPGTRGLSGQLVPIASIGRQARQLEDTSLRDGTSRFYAEITCLKRVVSLADGERPLLYLLDEILQGTNSHDRRIGATEVVRGLVERGAIGLITTHDLALAEIAVALGARGRNLHFEDQLVEGRMSFDHRLREGVVTRSNALALMRAVGLEV